MTNFSVDTQQITNTANLVNSCGNNIRSEVQTMMSYLNQLQSNWHGVASTQFHDLASRWHTTQLQVEQCLNDISRQMMIAANTYAEAEQHASALFTQ